ncbi:DUF2975 domain-containing protein [Bacillus pseudomycoides]|uniref:DUF2975 domain-containing protein n=1 Tax=Bacillus pseudomycoides TaxID=64104 RepID=UPI000BEC4D31|nr:DUF2975 domain-containing protein [Bacillus pseudomycoides]PEA80897.1 hypothetical protein CON99_25625 [Bacillus pseudomycoides]PEJ27894.1 hypothetical protein CN677_27445 [Bacillus pseudomycoides]PEM72734.1 hypothetical protein CN632_21790 [Bacillus pseudomycoides]PGC52238.1 hypothetical protein COM14_04590 [Bacillus pseudomycoides]PGD20627.1 hypothetical protein COM30_29870 [Bacillus pseudomycoides]
MNQAKYFIVFEKAIKFFQGLFNIFYWVVIIGMFLGLGGIIAGIFVPFHILQDILTAEGLTFYYHSSYKIDVNHIQITKLRTLIINACIMHEVILTVLLFITIQLKRIVQFARNKQPFSKSCIKHIRCLAYGVIIYSCIFGLLGNIWDLLLVRTLQLSKTVISLNFNFEMMIMGFLLLFLSHIFKYGAYLQEEYDSTL